MFKYSKSIPNILTILRVLAAPLLLLTYLLADNSWLLASIFAFACVTDWLDGYIARKQKSFSALGSFLDPVADKLLVTAALMVIVHSHKNIFLLVFAVIIVSREIAVSALREWMAAIGKIKLMRVLQIAKIKTFVQMLGVGLLLLDFDMYFNVLGFVLLMVATVLTLYSMIQYLKIAAQDLTFFSEST